MRIALGIVILALLITSNTIQFSASTSAPQNLEQVIRQTFAKWDRPNSPGCALGVMREGRLIYARGFGMANLDHGIPIRPSTVFHVASVSKHFTVTAILLLMEQGKLSLDDPVARYLPEMPNFGATITLRHLIHHTSGLRDQWELLGLAGWRYSFDLITDDDVLAVFRRQRALNFPPGSQFLYCNTGYTLLAQIVQRISGQSFREFTTQNIFSPLGMRRTHFRDNHAEIVREQAYGYNPTEQEGFALSLTQFDTVGATSLLTTVEDLARWDRNFYEPKVGGAWLVQQLAERGRLNSGEPLDYAFGLMLGQYRGLRFVHHPGSDAGYRAHFIRFPEQRFSVALLCNAGATVNTTLLVRRVADLFLGAEMTDPSDWPFAAESVELVPEQLSRWVGLYWNEARDAFREVMLRNGTLWIASGGEPVALQPLAADRFRTQRGYREIRFETQNTNQSILLERFPGDEPDTYVRVQPHRPEATVLDSYRGTYVSEEIEPVYRIVLQEGNRLVLHRWKARPVELKPALPDVFFTTLGTIRFTRDPSGAVSGFILNGNRVRNFKFTKQ